MYSYFFVCFCQQLIINKNKNDTFIAAFLLKFTHDILAQNKANISQSGTVAQFINDMFYYTKEQLVRIFMFLSSVDYKLKSGELSSEYLIDYVLIKIAKLGELA